MLCGFNCIDDTNRTKIKANTREGLKLPVPHMANENDIAV